MHATDPSAIDVATMRAVRHDRYGDPAVLAVVDRQRPTPRAGEVLVRVCAASVSVGDHHVVTGKPYLVRVSPFGGLPKPRHPVPGQALAGVVVAVAADVTSLQVGDAVFGECGTGAWAAYATAPAALLVKKPASISFDDAAAIPWAATALQALRDAGAVQPGQRVLINGASGAVGTWAVQIARALGASVTAICSTRHVELVRGLGADEVIDYRTSDVVDGGARFDVVIDLVGNRSVADSKRVLKDTGIFVACSGGGGDWVGPIVQMLIGVASFAVSKQRYRAFMMTPKRDDLVWLADLVERGAARPVIEHRFALNDIAAALTHVGSGHAQGQSVLHLAD